MQWTAFLMYMPLSWPGGDAAKRLQASTAACQPGGHKTTMTVNITNREGTSQEAFFSNTLASKARRLMKKGFAIKSCK